jgi:hypothetical protein
LDAGKWGTCTSPKKYSALGQGSHTFSVRARKSGVVDRTPAVRTFTVDTVKPQTTLESAPFRRVTDHPVSFAFSSNETGSFQCRMNTASPFAPCVSPFVPTLLIPDTMYAFQVRARDPAGNLDATPASYEFGKVTELSFSQETGEEAADYFIPPALTLDVPASCGSDPEIDCSVNGTPIPPADQVSISSTRSVTRHNGENRYSVSMVMDAATLPAQKISFRYQGVACDLTFDSGDDPTPPTWTLTYSMNVVTHATYGQRFLSPSNHDLTGVDDGDIQISGDFLCGFAGAFIDASFVADQLEGVFADMMPITCMAPGPALFEICPWAFGPM